jgi:uncharacterized coiled-coil protein SlyX
LYPGSFAAVGRSPGDETAQQRIERLEALMISQAATINHLQGVNEQLVRSINEHQKTIHEYQETINKMKNDVKQLKDDLAGENVNSGINSDSSSSPPLKKIVCFEHNEIKHLFALYVYVLCCNLYENHAL